MQRVTRLKRELKFLIEEPLANIAVHTTIQNGVESMERLRAQIIGSKKSVYENGVFDLDIFIPDRYPLVAPVVRFLTPVYHPNIDKSGRICLDLLTNTNEWKPSANLALLLLSIQTLLHKPNPEDSLRPEIGSLYRNNFDLFKKNAKMFTKEYAMQTARVNNKSE